MIIIGKLWGTGEEEGGVGGWRVSFKECIGRFFFVVGWEISFFGFYFLDVGINFSGLFWVRLSFLKGFLFLWGEVDVEIEGFFFLLLVKLFYKLMVVYIIGNYNLKGLRLYL